MKLIPPPRPAAVARACAVPAATARAVAEMSFELVPMAGVDAAVAALPPAARVSVTCSPVKGIVATTDLCTRLVGLGHDAVPHLAARMVEDHDHVARIAAWIRDLGRREVFVIAGDAATPRGPYADATSFLRALLAHDSGLARVGVAAYPDGHPLIPDDRLGAALHDKQALASRSGVAATATTQMCFDAGRVERWLRAERERGLEMPVVLGVPGVVDRAKLVVMGMRLGIGASLRYLRKNRGPIKTMLAPAGWGRGYDPTALVTELVAGTADLGATELHVFTFNNVADTVAWQRGLLAP